MTKRLTGFTVLAVTLLVLASVPMFNQPTAVAQGEEGDGDGACVRTGGCIEIPSYFCAEIYGEWYGEGSSCERHTLVCESVFGLCPPASAACCLGDGGCFAVVPDLCVEMGGTPSRPGTTCLFATCDQPCYGDVDGDGTVGINDFLDLLGAWGDCK